MALLGLASASPITTGSETTNTINITARGTAASNSKFTWYNTGLGACGQSHSDGEHVIAMSAVNFDPHTPNGNPNNNALCGRRIRASYNGRSVVVTVVDRCPGCPEHGLDLSPGAFQQLADLGTGVIQGSWEWI
ncbi:hypothetical protein BT67DRAFT_388670 [Trichocladium antarcticum]|uniref:RlpA-like protein double-psi beta-barrel domain-containing protein n=1 Tax=Trichocladium antarcticum TaxID=1450529 RepID=A0AAN6UE13_9PEZI|nr:hypothetical protein BT67DRAFT_388670 [Trichocladium antarcticum]